MTKITPQFENLKFSEYPYDFRINDFLYSEFPSDPPLNAFQLQYFRKLTPSAVSSIPRLWSFSPPGLLLSPKGNAISNTTKLMEAAKSLRSILNSNKRSWENGTEPDLYFFESLFLKNYKELIDAGLPASEVDLVVEILSEILKKPPNLKIALLAIEGIGLFANGLSEKGKEAAAQALEKFWSNPQQLPWLKNIPPTKKEQLALGAARSYIQAKGLNQPGQWTKEAILVARKISQYLENTWQKTEDPELIAKAIEVQLELPLDQLSGSTLELMVGKITWVLSKFKKAPLQFWLKSLYESVVKLIPRLSPRQQRLFFYQAASSFKVGYIEYINLASKKGIHRDNYRRYEETSEAIFNAILKLAPSVLGRDRIEFASYLISRLRIKHVRSNLNYTRPSYVGGRVSYIIFGLAKLGPLPASLLELAGRRIRAYTKNSELDDSPRGVALRVYSTLAPHLAKEEIAKVGVFLRQIWYNPPQGEGRRSLEEGIFICYKEFVPFFSEQELRVGGRDLIAKLNASPEELVEPIEAALLEVISYANESIRAHLAEQLKKTLEEAKDNPKLLTRTLQVYSKAAAYISAAIKKEAIKIVFPLLSHESQEVKDAAARAYLVLSEDHLSPEYLASLAEVRKKIGDETFFELYSGTYFKFLSGLSPSKQAKEINRLIVAATNSTQSSRHRSNLLSLLRGFLEEGEAHPQIVTPTSLIALVKMMREKERYFSSRALALYPDFKKYSQEPNKEQAAELARQYRAFFESSIFNDYQDGTRKSLVVDYNTLVLLLGPKDAKAEIKQQARFWDRPDVILREGILAASKNTARRLKLEDLRKAILESRHATARLYFIEIYAARASSKGPQEKSQGLQVLSQLLEFENDSAVLNQLEKAYRKLFRQLTQPHIMISRAALKEELSRLRKIAKQYSEKSDPVGRAARRLLNIMKLTECRLISKGDWDAKPCG